MTAIGILAVLAAIAIPSVAGLIDRANVSADATNANEMTNAIERFTSEYELHLQDIASGRLDTTNLDSAQGRVFNVTGVTDRAGIEALEKDATAGVDTTGKAIYRDTKYPVNAETMQAVVENYMKTSSATFTPKQSDCHYYYSPDCGLVVCTETEASSVTDLNKLVQSGKDAKGKDLGASTKWIDLTANTSADNGGSTNCCENPNIQTYSDDTKCLNCSTITYGEKTHEGLIPANGRYYDDYTSTTYDAGEPFPNDLSYGFYTYGDYDYSYINSEDGWQAVARNNQQTTYENFLIEIAGKKLISLENCFYGCRNMTTAPEIPESVYNLDYAFAYCTSLTGYVTINSTVITKYDYCFDEVDFIHQYLKLDGSINNLDTIGSTAIEYCEDCNGGGNCEYCDVYRWWTNGDFTIS